MELKKSSQYNIEEDEQLVYKNNLSVLNVID